MRNQILSIFIYRNKIIYLILFLLSFHVAGKAQSFSLPCKKYPASVPFKCDAAVDYYWHVTSVKCLGPANGGYKFRISGRANKSHGRESIDLLYLRGGNSVSVAGAYFFPNIEEGKLFSFDIVSAFRGHSPSKFNGFLIISQPLQASFQQELEASQEEEAETPQTEENVETAPESPKESASVITFANPSDSPSNENSIHDKIEQMPSFPGGKEGLYNYLCTNLHYPPMAQKSGIQGRVVMEFIVETDGSLSNIKVLKSATPSLDAEAKRLVEAMPKWIPGMNNGCTVRVKFAMPINFRLN